MTGDPGAVTLGFCFSIKKGGKKGEKEGKRKERKRKGKGKEKERKERERERMGQKKTVSQSIMKMPILMT